MYASPRPSHHCQEIVRDSQEAALDGNAVSNTMSLARAKEGLE